MSLHAYLRYWSSCQNRSAPVNWHVLHSFITSCSVVWLVKMDQINAIPNELFHKYTTKKVADTDSAASSQNYWLSNEHRSTKYILLTRHAPAISPCPFGMEVAARLWSKLPIIEYTSINDVYLSTGTSVRSQLVRFTWKWKCLYHALQSKRRRSFHTFLKYTI